MALAKESVLGPQQPDTTFALRPTTTVRTATVSYIFLFLLTSLSAARKSPDGFDQPDHGGSVSEPGNGSAERDEGDGGARVLRGLVAGAGAKDPLLRVDVGVVSAGEGLALQDGETPALQHGKLLAGVSACTVYTALLALCNDLFICFPRVWPLFYVFTLGGVAATLFYRAWSEIPPSADGRQRCVQPLCACRKMYLCSSCYIERQPLFPAPLVGS